MAMPVRKELQPYWSAVLMAVRDEMTAFISWLVVCDKRLHFERENAEESLVQALFKHRNGEQIQMKNKQENG
jgi:hypothetical protein